MRFWAAIALALLATLYGQAFAAEGYVVPSLVDQQMTAWTAEGDCEAEVVNKTLRLKAGKGWLRSHHAYRDFHLHFEWKAPETKDFQLGISLRAQKPGTPFLKTTYQGNAAAGLNGPIKRGEWNTYDITVRGKAVTLRTNQGEPSTAEGLTDVAGYIGLEVGGPGGSEIQFRNIRVTEFGFQSLLDDQELTHWEGAGQPPETCWQLNDGVLTCVKPKGPWLRSKREYGDFNLRLQYRVQAGGNSGVYVRVPHDGNHHRDDDSKPPAGFEVQILDDSAEKYRNLKAYQFSASVYDICGASPRVCRPPGQWNTLEIDCKGNTVRTIHNGVEVVNVTRETHPKIELRQTHGYLGLQNHGVGVSFRYLRIRAE